jgi:hypothetical protein
MFGPAGAARLGSRKNATVLNKSSKKNQNAHAENNPKTIASSARKAKIHRASQRAWKRIKEPIFRSSKALVKPLEFAISRHSARPQYSGLGGSITFN